ncbi:MAG: sensor histidine kinase [Planctomycetota bacterium]|jgi:signal transduction histidine kinase
MSTKPRRTSAHARPTREPVGSRRPLPEATGLEGLHPKHERARVLIVDDEAKTVAITKDILELDGLIVSTAGNAAEALAQLEGPDRFNAVVTDIRMPGMSGIELLARVRELRPGLPVLIVTGHATVATAAKAVEEGATEYLFKPIDFDRLKQAIHRAVERQRLLADNRRLVGELRRANRKLGRMNRELESRVHDRARELVLERDLLDSVFATIPSALLVLGPDALPQRSNAAWEDLLGLGPRVLKALAEPVRIALEDGDPTRLVELRLPDDPDASQRSIGAGALVHTLHASVLPLCGERALVTIADRSDEIRLEQELVQTEKLASLGTLASGVVHDLANPLTAVLGTVEMFIDDPDAHPFREELDTILEAATYMRSVCSALSDYSRRAGSGRSELCDLNELCERAVQFAGFSKSFQRVRPILDLSREVPTVRGNPTELLQVILNLIVNGADATPRGGRLALRTCRGPLGSAILEVQDEGAGFSDRVRKHMFEPFFTTKPKGQGTGLGLYMAQRIIERFGGSIEGENGAHGGAVFRMRLPAGTAEPSGVESEVI